MTTRVVEFSFVSTIAVCAVIKHSEREFNFMSLKNLNFCGRSC